MSHRTQTLPRRGPANAGATDAAPAQRDNGDMKRALAAHAAKHPNPVSFNRAHRAPSEAAATAHRDQYRS